jgi:Zn-dependent M16 (insulinase) family peptidase
LLPLSNQPQSSEPHASSASDSTSAEQEAFRKIKDATGVSDVNEVIQKFLTQDETHNNLVVMTKEAQARIDALNEEKAQAKAKVEEIKYSGTGSLGSRRIVDEFESHLSEVKLFPSPSH